MVGSSACSSFPLSAFLPLLLSPIPLIGMETSALGPRKSAVHDGYVR